MAISDRERRLAVPHGTIRAGQPPHDLKAVAAIVRDNDVDEIVVGHPLSLTGRAGEQAHHAARFAEALRSALAIPVHLEDERLSTVEAERSLSRAGVRGRARRQVVDQHAATVILQAYLDRTR